MKIAQLVYASRMSAPLSMDAIAGILGKARAKNVSNGITGVMTFGNECFLQLIEGPPAAINGLYAELQRDPRHRDLQLLGYGIVDARRFADWSMGFLQFDKVSADASTPFNPFELSIEESLARLNVAGNLAGIAA